MENKKRGLTLKLNLCSNGMKKNVKGENENKRLKTEGLESESVS